MIHVGKERVYNTLDAAHEPAATVAPGSVVEIETQLNGGDWLNGIEDLWDPSKSRGPNLTTVVAVEGARPGDTLVVEVLDVVPGPLGYTGFAGWRNPLSQLIWENDWDVVTKTVRIESEEIRRALNKPLDDMTKAVKDALDATPPDLASDLMYYGILLTGGGALLRGLDVRLRDETGVPVNVSPTALDNVVNGCSRVLEANAFDGGFVQSNA